MSRVPITLMGYHCERCAHEWVPRGSADEEPRVCPKCRSPWWNRPRKTTMPYEEFRDRISKTLTDADRPLTWTEIRTISGLHQALPNNQWVHRLESDIGLNRQRGASGIIHWELKLRVDVDLFESQTVQAAHKGSAPPRRK
jgi:predicted Zn-ribbon and HTH transcriptional regulator